MVVANKPVPHTQHFHSPHPYRCTAKPAGFQGIDQKMRNKWITASFICLLSSLQCKPPLEVNDLFEDIKDGVKLLALLEVLSGQKLVSIASFYLKQPYVNILLIINA